MLLERELPCEIKDITECLASFRHPIEWVGFEAGTMSQHLFYGLKAEGFDVVCMEARQVNAALSAMRNKTDKNDARGIAQVLRTGWFSPVHMKSREAHGVRALLSTRKALLKKTMDLCGTKLSPNGPTTVSAPGPGTKSLRDRGACFGRCAEVGFVSLFVMLGVCCWSR
jgi:hypothetical protein